MRKVFCGFDRRLHARAESMARRAGHRDLAVIIAQPGQFSHVCSWPKAEDADGELNRREVREDIAVLHLRRHSTPAAAEGRSVAILQRARRSQFSALTIALISLASDVP
jgi:hypothetical protein